MKVYLRELEEDVRYKHDDEITALIRVARAAKAYMLHPYLTQHEFKAAKEELIAALSDIEDSKQ